MPNDLKDKNLNSQTPRKKLEKNGFKSSSGFFSKKNNNILNVLETDLIKDEIDVQLHWKKDIVMFFILLFLVVIFSVEACFLLNRWGKDKELDYSNYLSQEITQVKQEIGQLKDEYNKAVAFNNQLKMSSSALNKHIYWSRFFYFLEKHTLKNNIYYKNFSGNISGVYILPAVTNDVLAINYQSGIYSSSPLVSSATASDEEIVNDEINKKTLINFNLNLTLNSQIFN